MKLLFAVDSITTLNILLDEVVVRSWPNGTEARVLSVVEDGEVPLETWREEGYGVAAVRQEMRRRGEQITALAVERLSSIGIPTEVTIMRGNPQDLIPFAARKWATDLIFIRANNRADFRNWLLGSVAKSVVESAPCSVEVVRGADETHSGGDRRNFKILLATDGSDASLRASQVVANTKWPESTEVKVVSVVNPVTYSLEEIGLWRDKGTERAHRAIGQAVQALKNAPLKITGEVIASRIASGILSRARNWGADLIVLATHDGRGLKRFFLSGTSAAVAKRAHCSVRVVRGRGFSQNDEPSFSGPVESPENGKSMYKTLGLRSAA
jgi:nucleotide-binding universal stress UspA family protein